MSQTSFDVKDPNFCSRCGTVLPQPSSNSRIVKCQKCSLTIEIGVFHERVVHRCIEFNKILDKPEGEGMLQTAGPSVDRTCSSCGNATMTYRTQQTRSADEGQTVFFSCPECGNQEIEYS